MPPYRGTGQALDQVQGRPWQPSFPCVRHYADGRQVLVHTPEALGALEPGHAGSPAGPFPEPLDRSPEPAPDVIRGQAPAAGWEKPAGVDVSADPRAQEARRLYVAGRSQQSIADELDVSRYMVRRWLEEDDDADDR